MAFPRAEFLHKTASNDACADSPPRGCLSGETTMSNQLRAMRPTRFVRPPSRLLSVMLLFALAPALADDTGLDTSTVEFSIPAQTVPAALGEFARQAQVQLFFISDGFENVRANAVIGAYTRQHALNLLLAGTGLRASLSPESELEVRPVSSSMTAETGDVSLLAAAKLSAEGEEAQSSDVGPDGDSAEAGDAESGKQRRALDEIVVTGTHIRGVESVGASTITFTREDLAKGGFSTVEEVFESLPQNLDEISVDAATANGTSALARANSQGTTSVSLRGLGAGSTLVLLDGKRRPGNMSGRAVDISAIPISMVERVEIVTGGRSAIYGSDAVAGVVNIVTRSDYSGAESQIYYGESAAGGERINFSQTLGLELGRSVLALGYDYRKDQELDLTATGVVRTPTSSGRTPLPGLFYVQYPSEQHAGLLKWSFDFADNAELYADTHFSSDKNEAGAAYNIEDLFDVAQIVITNSDQYSAVAGIRFEIANEWQLDVSALHGAVDNLSKTANLSTVLPEAIISFDVPSESGLENRAQLTSLSAIADGTLGGSAISAALGIEVRDERFRSTRFLLPAGTVTDRQTRDRELFSVFGEVLLPVGSRNERRIEVSLAGRYDDYSDFGNTFNPQLGIDWKPMDGLTVRGSYSKAFRAPDLFTLGFANQLVLLDVADPGVPSGTATLLSESGGNAGLRAEEADTWTAGFDWKPSGRVNVSISYFDVEYDHRIDVPTSTFATALQEEDIFSELINRSPTPAELEEVVDRTNLETYLNFTSTPFDPATEHFHDVFPDIVYFDNRYNNIAIEKVNGIDLRSTAMLEASSGDWSFGLNGTYYLDFKRQVTATAPALYKLNQPGKPVDLRLRGNISWSRSAWNINTYVNYVDSYVDTFAATPAKIDSWTTVDLIVRFDTSMVTDNPALEGTRLTLAIDNALDEEPPEYLSNGFGTGYDAVNSNPLGRFVSLRIAKRW